MTFTLSRAVIGCLIALAFLAGAALGSPQLLGSEPVTPTVLSGADIGFRMTARKGDTPVGRLVVRVNGEWKEVEFTYAAKFVSN